MLSGLGFAGLLAVAMAIGTRFPSSLFSTLLSRTVAWRSVLTGRHRSMLLVTGAIGLYLVGNAILFPLGGDPFDLPAEKLFAYVAQRYGPVELYYLPNVVSLPWIWHGIPYEESGFPYEPVFAYLSAGIGWLQSLLFAGGGPFRADSLNLEYVIKAVNVAAGFGDSVLIFLILRRLKMTFRWSLIGSALFLFNPAVWYSMSVWGQTHVISLLFILAVVWFAETNRPLLAWLSLVAACLTRPQMLVFGLLLGIVLLKKFPWGRSLVALSWAAVLTFLLLLPFTLATSPSLPVDIMRNNFQIQEAGGNDPGLTPVSQGAYSIWPLVTYVTQGASGLQREFVLSSQTLVGSLTYQRASQILTGVTLLLLALVLAMRKRAQFESGGYIPTVALGITSFLMLLTAILSTHFLLALPLLLLCRRWTSGVGYFYIAIIWTVSSFVAMYGEMGAVLSSQDYPLLAPAHNVVTRFFVNLYSWDRFITVAVVGDICALIWLAFLAFKAPLRQAGALATASK
jgi:hypothetical protein